MQDWLGSDWRRRRITWLITKPLAILVLLLAAVAFRWFLHRLIDRLVRRAAEGMPSPVLRRQSGAARPSRPATRAGRPPRAARRDDGVAAEERRLDRDLHRSSGSPRSPSSATRSAR